MDKRLELTEEQEKAIKELGKAIDKCAEKGLMFIIGDDETFYGNKDIRFLNTNSCDIVCGYPYHTSEDEEYYPIPVSKLKKVQTSALAWMFFQHNDAEGYIAVKWK